MRRLLQFIICTICTVVFLKAGTGNVSKFANIGNKLDVKKYDVIFKQISTKRVGLDDKNLSKVPTPFVNKDVLRIIKDKNATKKKRIILKLYGIFDNKANINKKWYKIKSKVYSYRLTKIKNISVILKRKRKKLELFLRKKNDKIQITKKF